MQAPVHKTVDNTLNYAAQRSFREVCQAAIRVFNLMDKYHTAPVPKAYAVLFAYTTGSDEALVEEVNNLVLLKDQLSPYDIESLYQEFLAEDAGTFATQGIGQAIGNEIGAVLDIIEKSLKQSDDFTQTLDTFAEQVPQAMSGDNLASVVSGLLAENRRMADLTRDLNEGLAKSQGLITVLNHQLEDVQAQALRDPVTSIPNRRAFDARLEEAASRAMKSNEGFCVVLAGIDGFSALTDAHGIAAGDTVLRGFAELTSASVEGADMVARYGAEEVAMILTGRDLMSAYNLLVKIKHEFKKMEHPLEGSSNGRAAVTASFGLARCEPGMTARDVIAQADAHLREARKSGRNLVKARGIG